MIQTPRVFDGTGQIVSLGREIGRGGEGSVYELSHDSRHVAKIYHLPVSRDKAAKLESMVRSVTADLAAVAAWPIRTLYLQPQGNLAGLLMPRLESNYREVHQLYGPAHRRITFPKADWSFLIYAARNLASVIDTIHHHGHVIGDINQGNFLVSPGALIKLIDCDSLQISVSGHVYPCDVGVGHFTSPELQDTKSFHAIRRTVVSVKWWKSSKHR